MKTTEIESELRRLNDSLFMGNHAGQVLLAAADMITDAADLREALSDYYWDLIRVANGSDPVKSPMELARNAERILRATEYIVPNAEVTESPAEKETHE